MHVLALLLCSFFACAQPGGVQYEKKATWRETWRAALATTRDSSVRLGPWYYIGPFDHSDNKGFAAVYPPEQEVDLAGTYRGKGGRELRWQEGRAFKDGAVNSLRIFEDNDWIVAYMYRALEADDDICLNASFGSDDGLKVWINGQQMIAHEAGRACEPDQHLVTLPLHRGTNELLIKVTQGEGPSGFYFDARGTAPYLGPWYYIGPFDNSGGKGFSAVYPPEQGVDLGASYRGKGGREVRWQEGKDFRDGTPNSLRIFPDDDNDNIAAYMFREIRSDRDRPLSCSFGSDDGIKVWLNGQLVVQENTSRACQADQNLAVLSLRKGRNELLIKVVQGGGPSGFYFSATGGKALLQSLTERLLEDFPESALEIMVEQDWMAQDEVSPPDGPYLEAVRRTLVGTQRLLADLRDDRPASFLSEQAERLDRLTADIQALQRELPEGKGERWLDLYLKLHWLRREIALANPLLDFDQLVFVKRMPGRYSHMCDQYYGWHARAGGGLFVLEKVGRSLALRNIVGEQLPEGSFLQPELSFDARRILFAYWCARPGKPSDKFFNIYEIGVDGTGLRRLTDGEYDDFCPCYLPDGGVMFISTRRGGYGRCHGRPVPLYTLHRMNADGSGIRCLSFNEANEWHPSVLDDGRIVYARWDYVDRHAVDYQSLWTCWPDGSDPVALYGNATKNPMANYEPRQIPGSHAVVSTVAAHHAYTTGSLVTVDPRLGFEGMAPLKRLTPEVPFVESEGWPNKYAYATPWPLSHNYYLCAFSLEGFKPEGGLNSPNQHGLYLVDAFGNRELLYRDPAISSMYPVPLKPRRVPPVLTPRSDPGAEAEASLLLLDIYRSMEGVPRDAIKSLRVVQLLPKATPIADVPRLGVSGQETGKLVLGTVPVNEDGSAFFRVPAGKAIFFQALDVHGKAVQSMRTLTYLQPGQTVSCVGCHEDRNSTPPVTRPAAAIREPVNLTPGPDGSAPLSYPILVQPVLDRHCIRCHSGEKPRADLDLTGALTEQFTRSYESLMNRPGLVFRWSAYNGEPTTMPMQFGSYQSRLVTLLERGHHGVQLDAEEWERILTWIDVNANFYGTFIPEEQRKQQRGERIAMPALQ